jgi:glycosyltransferase involved in cell wall biosynthesis
MNKKNYLIIAMSRYWEWQNGVENRNFHIVNGLRRQADTNLIIMVEYLPYNFKQCLKNFVYAFLKQRASLVIKTNLFSRLQKIDDTFFVLSVWCIPNKKFWRYLNKLIKDYFNDNYYMWSYLPTCLDYFNELTKAKANIFDAVDDWSKHYSYKKIENRLIENYQKINNLADFIFTVSPALEKKFNRSEKVYFIPNGVDFNHFQRREKIINRDIVNLPKPIIGYIGTIQTRFNWDIIEAVSKKLPKASIVLIGPIWHRNLKNKLKTLTNVYCLGPKPYQQAPTYIQQFSVGIIPNVYNDFEKSTDPMKIYSYLACGKPVVISYLPANEKLRPYIHVATVPEEFAEAVASVYADDNKEQYKKRLEFAKNQNWSNRLKLMLEIINKHVNN